MKENKKFVSWKYSVMGNRSGRNEEKQENRPLEILGDGEPERTKPIS